MRVRAVTAGFSVSSLWASTPVVEAAGTLNIEKSKNPSVSPVDKQPVQFSSNSSYAVDSGADAYYRRITGNSSGHSRRSFFS